MIHPTEDLRDYAVGEIEADRQPALEQHLAACGDCTLELDRMRLTTAALRSLPDREVPQRIAFVSDKVFEPSPVSRWFAGFWNSSARLGFASACVLAAALVVFAYHRPADRAPVVIQTANVDFSKQVGISDQINDAVAKAVAQVRAEDSRMVQQTAEQMTKAAIEAANLKYEKEYQARMVAVEESFTVLQKRFSSSLIASNDFRESGAGQ
jgi:anti-sigma factor RsiW